MTYGFRLVSQGLIITRQVLGIAVFSSGIYTGYREYALGGGHSIFIKNVVEEAGINFSCDRTISESENKKIFDKLVLMYKKTA
jgi:hypothetical protein